MISDSSKNIMVIFLFEIRGTCIFHESQVTIYFERISGT